MTKRQIGKRGCCCSRRCGFIYQSKQKAANDPDIFELGSDTKYYLLGLLFTDGNLNKSKDKITLSLIDEELIKKLYVIFSDTNKRKIYKQNDNNENHSETYTIINTNKNTISKLLEIGLTSNKSLSLEFPEIAKENDKISFIRGIFDGDGSIYKQTTKSKNREYHYANISFTTGSEKYATGIINCLYELGIHSTLFIDKRKIKKNCTYYVYIRTKKSVKLFFDLIYNDKTSIYMQRKYLKYLII